MSTTPRAPSSLCSPTRTTVRWNVGSIRLGLATRSWPRRLSTALSSPLPSGLMRGASSAWSRVLAVALLLAAALGLSAVASAQGGERIHTYSAEIAVQADGSFLVVESFDYDFGSTPHHGIFRDIPDRLTYDAHHDRLFPIDVISVEGSPGTPTRYKIEHGGNLLRIKIGEADR